VDGTGFSRHSKALAYGNGQRVIYCDAQGVRIPMWASTGLANETATMFYDTSKVQIVYNAQGEPLRYVANSPTPYFDSNGVVIVYNEKKQPMSVPLATTTVSLNNQAATTQKMTDAQGKPVTFDQDTKTAFYVSGATNTQTGITVSLWVAVITAVVALL